MKIRYLGHAAFYLKPESGPSVITDPYRAAALGGPVALAPITEQAEVVLVSHQHDDHAGVEGLPGSPKVLTASGAVQGVEFRAAEAAHDAQGGAKRGKVRVFCFALDGVRVCHLGDLGEALSKAQLSEIGAVDVLLVPVGGYFTIDAAEAAKVVESLRPKVAIPMHYRTARVDFPISPVDDFLRLQKRVERVSGSEIEMRAETLPAEMTVYVLQAANG